MKDVGLVLGLVLVFVGKDITLVVLALVSVLDFADQLHYVDLIMGSAQVFVPIILMILRNHHQIRLKIHQIHLMLLLRII